MTRALLTPLAQLDLQGKLLQVQVVRHVVVDCLADDSGRLWAVFLLPLGVELRFGLDRMFLREMLARNSDLLPLIVV